MDLERDATGDGAGATNTGFEDVDLHWKSDD